MTSIIIDKPWLLLVKGKIDAEAKCLEGNK